MIKFSIVAFFFGVYSFLFIPSKKIFLSSNADTASIKAKPKKHPKFDVIVLDAGHGGKDPGAIGTKGYKEKQATLAIILKLGELIEKELPETKVIYTRKSDKFIELYKRGEIANEHKGKLFICI